MDYKDLIIKQLIELCEEYQLTIEALFYSDSILFNDEEAFIINEWETQKSRFNEQKKNINEILLS